MTAVSADYIIDVWLDREAGLLKCDSPERREFAKGCNVEWRFSELYPGSLPVIFFGKGGNTIPGDLTGPFEKVATSRGSVFGYNLESTGVFTYRCVVERGFGSIGVPQSCAFLGEERRMIVGHGLDECVVIVKPDPNNPNGLTVSKGHTVIRPGQRLRWDFMHTLEKLEPAQYAPLIVFGLPKAYAGKHPPEETTLGPFTSLELSANAIVGIGNNGVNGIYPYDAFIVDTASRTIRYRSTGDPQTDNEGSDTSGDNT